METITSCNTLLKSKKGETKIPPPIPKNVEIMPVKVPNNENLTILLIDHSISPLIKLNLFSFLYLYCLKTKKADNKDNTVVNNMTKH